MTVVLLSLLLLACDETQPSNSPEPGSETPATSEDPHGGAVLEVLSAGGYSYLLLATSEGEKWAAVPAAELSVGDTAHIEGAMRMTDFESPSLGRTFESILFGTLASEPAAAPIAEAPATPAPAAGQDLGVRTVVQIHEEQASIEGGSVTVSGTVTRSTPAILGKNWIHLDDGTGSSELGTHDLTVTTLETVEVGEVVTVTGTVARNVDLGMGYHFAVLVEDAAVSR
jgi:hypothetical protein